MSATLPNLPQLGAWLRARVFVSNFRPVPLHEYVKVGQALYLLRRDGALVHAPPPPTAAAADAARGFRAAGAKMSGSGSAASGSSSGGGARRAAGAPAAGGAAATPIASAADAQLAAQVAALRLQRVRALPPSHVLPGDPTRLVLLTAETLHAGGQVLVFAPTKAETQATALRLARMLPDALAVVATAHERLVRGVPPAGAAASTAAPIAAAASSVAGKFAPPSSSSSSSAKTRAAAARVRDGRLQLVNRLRMAAGAAANRGGSGNASEPPPLVQALRCGVAFHNADLSPTEREVVVAGFRAGLLDVIVATSTLAAGVNLPAQVRGVFVASRARCKSCTFCCAY